MSVARPLRRPSAAPSRSVLLGLGLAVLLAHLGLLSGGFAGLSMDLFAAPDAELSGTVATAPTQGTADAADADAADAAAPERPEPVRTSRVRWIVPKAPEPEPPPQPAPPVVKKPPPAPEPEPAPVQQPEPTVVVEAAAVDPPSGSSSALAQALPTEPVAPAPPALPAEAPVAAPALDPVASRLPASDAAPGTEAAAGTLQSAGLGRSDAGLPPARVPPSARLSYSVQALSKGANYYGSGRLDWSHDGQTYQSRLSAKVLFITVLSLSSEGRLSDKGLAPERFADSRRSERAAHFERATARIRYSNNAPDAVLLPGAQDRLSVNLQLAALFNARPDAYAEGQTLRLPVSGHDMSEVWLFRVGPMATERLPAGEILARKLTRSPRKEYDRTVELWLAPALAHLPVRLRLTDQNGDFVDMTLDELPVVAGSAVTPAN